MLGNIKLPPLGVCKGRNCPSPCFAACPPCWLDRSERVQTPIKTTWTVLGGIPGCHRLPEIALLKQIATDCHPLRKEARTVILRCVYACFPRIPSGGLAGTRTLDQCLKRALLYQLSYQPAPARDPPFASTPQMLLTVRTSVELLKVSWDRTAEGSRPDQTDQTKRAAKPNQRSRVVQAFFILQSLRVSFLARRTQTRSRFRWNLGACASSASTSCNSARANSGWRLSIYSSAN
jgi:hypothetical protein